MSARNSNINIYTSKEEQNNKEISTPCQIWRKKLTTALNSVDFPTLGRPTMPALKLMVILDENWRRRKPMVSARFGHWRGDFLSREYLRGRRAIDEGTSWWHAILAILDSVCVLERKKWGFICGNIRGKERKSLFSRRGVFRVQILGPNLEWAWI